MRSVSNKIRSYMEFSVQVEKPSSILRKMIIKVPSSEVKSHLTRGLMEVQKTAKLKGFRPGHAPISIISQYYGEDVRHRVFHNLIDQSFQRAVLDQKLKAIGTPKIDTPDHLTGEGLHDHAVGDGQDLTFTATFEVMPELVIQNYQGLAVEQEKVHVTDDQVAQVVENLRNAQAQMIPVAGGLVLEDGTLSSRPVQLGDFIDIRFAGGCVTPEGIQLRDDMKGEQLVEVGSKAFVPGFEEELIGMRRGETKTFRVTFPQDYQVAELAHQETEFTVTVNEIKEKELPILDDEFAQQAGYKSVSDLETQGREFLMREKKEGADRKVKSQLMSQVIEKNPFDVPQTLIESQTRALAQDWAQELKKQGFDEKMMQSVISQEIHSLKQRAENQVRGSLILEAIAREEKITVSPEEVQVEIMRLASSMQMEYSKLEDFYAKNSGRREDLEFKLRQERTLSFLLGRAKISWIEPEEKH